MAVGYDGSIRINTKIDNAGAESGLKTLSGSLKRFAAEVVVAFSVGAVVSFGKSCIDLASDLNEVKNVVDVTFGSASSKIYDFAKTATTQFGLSTLAAEQYTGTMGAMLKSMGFATDSAADMSIEMAGLAGDMASFYNLSTDEAFEKIRSGISGETEPLKVLGVTLSEANLSAYALSEGMGTAYNKMTEQNKALVRYNYLMSATADAQGDFARTSTSWANQVRVLKLNWDSVKATLGTSFITVLTPVLRMVNSILGSLNATATVFANFISAVTGTAQTATTAVAETAAATEDLTAATDANAASVEATGEAAKKASKSFASFDKVNALSDPSSAKTPTVAVDTTTTTAAADAGKAVDKSIDDMKASLADFFSKYQDGINRVKEQWKTLKVTASGIFDALGKQFAGVDIGGAAFKWLLNWIYATEAEFNLLIGVVGDLFVALNVPAIIQGAFEALSAACKAVGDAVVAITPGVSAFVQTALVPIASWIGGKIVDALKFLNEQVTKVGDWFTSHKEDFTILGQMIGDVAAKVWKLIEPLLDAAWDIFKKAIEGIIDVFLILGDWVLDNKQLVVDFLAVFTAFKAVGFIKEILSVIGSFVKLTTEMLLNNGQWLILKGHLIVTTGEMVLNNIQWAFLWTKMVLTNKEMLINNAQWLIMEARLAAINIVHAIFNKELLFTTLKLAIVIGGVILLIDLFKKVQEGWKNMSTVERVISVLGLLAVAAGVAAVAFGALQSAWTLGLAAAAIVAGTVAISAALNSAKSDAASSMTSSIPRLAKGAVIPPNREFIATLGDQKRGVNIEAPMETIKQGVAEVLADMDLSGGPISVNFTGSLAQIGRVLQPVVVRENKRRGKSLVEEGGI